MTLDSQTLLSIIEKYQEQIEIENKQLKELTREGWARTYIIEVARHRLELINSLNQYKAEYEEIKSEESRKEVEKLMDKIIGEYGEK